MTDRIIDPETGRPYRGFKGFSEERRKEIAARGGRSTVPEKRSFSKDRELAIRAGSMGGQAARKR